MASPQLENGYVRLSNELFEALLMRDFTKRQRAILDLIIRLSYGTGKKTAFIPLTKDFQVCGLPANKVRKELDGLRGLRVIGWDSSGAYWLNKDYQEWLTDEPTGTSEQRLRELLKLNLQTVQHDQNAHAQNGHDAQNGQQDMTETGISTCPKRSYEQPGNASGTRAEGASKDIFKDNIKDKKIVNINNKASSLFEDYQLPIMKHGKSLFPRTDGITQAVSHDLAEMLYKNQLPVELACCALDVTAELQKDEGFARNKLRSWLQVGVSDIEAAKEHERKTFNPSGGVDRATYRGTDSQISGQSGGKSIEDFIRRKVERNSSAEDGSL